MAGNKNSGRKPKAEENLLVEKLAELEPKAFLALQQGIEKGEFRFIQLYFHYRYGKPRDIKEIIIEDNKPEWVIPEIVWTNKDGDEESLSPIKHIYKTNL